MSIHACICVCVLLSNLLRFVVDWVTNVLCCAKLRCESTTNCPESKKKLRLSCSFIHFIAHSVYVLAVVVAVLISGCQYCYKFIGRIWVWLTSITKFQGKQCPARVESYFCLFPVQLFFRGFQWPFLWPENLSVGRRIVIWILCRNWKLLLYLIYSVSYKVFVRYFSIFR